MNPLLLLIPIVALFFFRRDSWKIPPAGEPYAALFKQTERQYRLPPKLLARVAYQESRFRPDIITGKTISPAGAVGMMQIIPRWHPDAYPLDVPAAIDYAGSYLRKLYKQFGSWREALAAYNWGPGNLRRAIDAHGAAWSAYAPAETQSYIANILTDIPEAA